MKTHRLTTLVRRPLIITVLTFGWISDRIGRKVGMIFASLWLALWGVISGLAYGGGGSINGMFAALVSYSACPRPSKSVCVDTKPHG